MYGSFDKIITFESVNSLKKMSVVSWWSYSMVIQRKIVSKKRNNNNKTDNLIKLSIRDEVKTNKKLILK